MSVTIVTLGPRLADRTRYVLFGEQVIAVVLPIDVAESKYKYARSNKTPHRFVVWFEGKGYGAWDLGSARVVAASLFYKGEFRRARARYQKGRRAA